MSLALIFWEAPLLHFADVNGIESQAIVGKGVLDKAILG